MFPISLRQFTMYLCTRACGALALLLALSVMAPATAQDSASLQTSLFLDTHGQLGVDDMAAQTFVVRSSAVGSPISMP